MLYPIWFKVITADGATIEMGADVYFRVRDAILSVTNIQDLNYSTRIICQTSLQKHIAKKNLGDIENDRQTITNSLQVVLGLFYRRTITNSLHVVLGLFLPTDHH